MLTYQLQQRRFVIKDGEPAFSFPNDIEIIAALAPEEPFGARQGASRTGIRNQDAKVLYNSNTGAATIQSVGALDKLEVTVKWTNLTLSIDGNQFKLSAHLEQPAALQELLIGIQGVLPAILCIYFLDAPVITHVTGRVGQTNFRWEFFESQFRFDVTTNEKQTNRAVNALDLYVGLANQEQTRFAGGIVYFQRACRLIAAGNGPWEFMGEAVLNFAKCLQALFGESREDVRKGLRKCGFGSEIEDVFIPIMLMRNEFDVGHTWLSAHQADDLRLIYGLLADAEHKFRDLLEGIAAKLIAGESPLDSYSLKNKPSPVQSILDRLRAKIAVAPS